MKQQPTIKITRKGKPNGPAIRITRAPKVIPVPYGMKGGGQLAMKNKKKVIKKTIKKVVKKKKK